MTSLEGTYYDKFCAEKARAERLSALLLDPPPDVQELVIKKLDLVHRSLVDAEKARADCAERKADLYRHEKHAWDKTVRERDEARAACAEMRAIIREIARCGGHLVVTDEFWRKANHADSLDCGKGFLPPEMVKVVTEALQAAFEWGLKPWREGGGVPELAEHVMPLLDKALAALKQ